MKLIYTEEFKEDLKKVRTQYELARTQIRIFSTVRRREKTLSRRFQKIYKEISGS
jgi:hypothetical protein